MSGRAGLAILAILLVAGCTSSTTPDPTTPVTTAPTASTSTVPAPVTATGRLVIVDETGNVATMSPDGGDRRALTDDGGPTTRHFQPIWSPDGSKIAWSEAAPGGSRVLISADDASAPRGVEMAMFPFYLSWSPDGTRLGALHNGSSGEIDFELVDVDALTTTVVDTGAPYYFSWEPEGDGILAHASGGNLVVIEDDATVVDGGGTTPNFSAPIWAPAGFVYMTADGVVLDDQSREHLLASADGFVSLVGSPDGSRIAVQVIGDDGEGQTVALQEVPRIAPNTISIIDVETGEVTAASTSPSLGMFWSPDGERLLLLVPADQELGFEVVVVEDGSSTTIGNLTLSASLVTETLQFFDQYAQSWQMWSPDSTAVVLPGAIGDERGVWMFPVAGEPTRVSGGSWAAWSPA